MDDYGLGFAAIGLGVIIILMFAFLMPPSPRINVVADTTLSFVDEVVMVEYGYSWWGLGGIERSTVTVSRGLNLTRKIANYTSIGNDTLFDRIFRLPQNFTLQNYTETRFSFAGNLAIEVGRVYRIRYNYIIYSDNRTEARPLTIEIAEGEG